MTSEAKEIESLLQEVWTVVRRLREEKAEWLSRQQWSYATERCQQIIEASQKERLNIGVVAHARSGKSSLINALLGISVLQTEASSAALRLITVHYTPRRKGSKLKLIETSGKASTGLEGVRQRLNELLSAPIAERWQIESPLELNAAFCKALEGEGDHPTTPAVKLDVVEIPSVPVSGADDFLTQKMKTYIETLDGIFFLFDMTKLRTSEEEMIIHELKELIQLHTEKRIFVLVTKADRLGTEEDIDVDDTKNHVCELLHQHGIYLHHSQVFVVSAKIALLSRLVMADKNEMDLHQQFGNLVWGKEADKMTDKGIWKAKAAILLDLSGVVKFEESVLEFLHQNCQSLQELSLMDASIKVLEDLLDGAYAFKTFLSRSLQETRNIIERSKSDLDNHTLQLQSARSGLIRLEQDVVIKVKEALMKLKNAQLARIGLAFSWDYGEEKVLKDLPSGWIGIRQDFLALISHQEMDPLHGEELLKELHEEVMSQIHSEMDITWKIIESMSRDQHFELVLHTNEQLDRLSKLWEPITGKDLNVQIEPADIKLKPLLSNNFYQHLQDLLKMGMKEHFLEKTTFQKWTFMSPTKVFIFDGGSIREYFENVIRSVMDEAIDALKASVKRHVSGQIASCQEKMSIFGEHFCSGVESSIEERTSQMQIGGNSIKSVINDIETLKKIKSRVVEMKCDIESELKLGDLQLGLTATPSAPVSASASGGGGAGASSQLLRSESASPRQIHDKSKYVPPRSRSTVQDSSILPPSLHPEGRTVSLPCADLMEMANSVESPKAAEEGQSSWISRTNSWNSSNWAAAPPIQRTPPSSNTAGNSNTGMLSPRSDFFRGFDKATRGKRGRGTEHRRIGSWT